MFSFDFKLHRPCRAEFTDPALNGNVQASIWARPSEARTFFDVSFQRSYRDQNGHWKNTQSFDLNGLLALQHAVGLPAHCLKFRVVSSPLHMEVKTRERFDNSRFFPSRSCDYVSIYGLRQQTKQQ